MVRSPDVGWDGAATIRGYQYADFDVEDPPMRDVMIIACRRGTTVREPGSNAALSFRREHAVQDYVQSHLHHRITLDEFARVAGLSKFHFAGQFKSSTETSPHEFVLRRHLDRAVRPSPAHRLRLRLRSQAPQPEENPP